MTVERRNGKQNDEFPLGLRVLAVDDNPTCLMVLENLLRKCQYHVTTTNQAIHALQLLRENKNQFDLVISDVDMPDMDGFKLLELVGLEMDLPVIMLSAYGDTKLVMKGITHGACDYLLKPVRIEELKNIWQHVLRRKKFDCKEQKISDKLDGQPGESGRGFSGMRETDWNSKHTRKRKDQNDEEDEEYEENGERSEDPPAQKKPRVVWSVELHQKFVAVVNHLGIDKAVPKTILKLMNVENLTRENVASHLQKYRVYLKRLSSQRANMVSVLGSANPSYLRMCSLNNNIGNAPFRFGMPGFAPSSMIQLANNAPNSCSSTNSDINFQRSVQTGNQDMDILEGLPMPLGIDQVKNNLGVTHFQELSNVNLDRSFYPFSNGMPDRTINDGNNLLNTKSFNGKWPKATQSNLLGANSFATSAYSQHAMPMDLGKSGSILKDPMGSNLHSPLNSMCPQVLGSKTEMQCLTVDNVSGVKMNFSPQQGWDDFGQGSAHVSNLVCSSATRQHDEFGNASLDMKQGYLEEQQKLAGNNAYGKIESLEDIVSMMFGKDNMRS